MLSMWAVVPFCSVIFCLALLPALMPHTWEAPWRRLAIVSVPVLCGLVAAWQRSPQLWRHELAESLTEYVAFMALLASLYGVAAGIVVQGGFRPGPRGNVLWLTAGSLLASILGTTGASMLLLRPFLRNQQGRRYTAHTVVFFILTVSNTGGMLLPMGGPPLFLGYLLGVPFTWTLRLAPFWALTLALLLGIFWAIDTWADGREPGVKPPQQQPFALQGAHNVGLFAALLLVIVLAPMVHLGPLIQAGLMAAVLAASVGCTPKNIYQRNGATIEPMVEVATVFLALFVTMPQALQVLAERAPTFGSLSPSGFFWLTGGLSAVLDNAPCYLSFATLAQSQHHLLGPELTALAQDAAGSLSLAAIATGAVSLGAMTYIGNGPNLMVRAVAQEASLSVPSFGGYIAWTSVTLLPVLVVVRLILAA